MTARGGRLRVDGCQLVDPSGAPVANVRVKATATKTNTIRAGHVKGGYAQTMFMKKWKGQVFTPFYRFQYYSGGKKHEQDARNYLVRDHDLGLEWQQNNFFEITGQYTFADRTYEDAGRPNNRQQGQVFRVQFQVNY